MRIKDIKGLKYPDEYFIKYFFKNRFHERSGLKFFEFGCGNGNNLSLPYEYNFDVVGIDFDEESISNAKFNFSQMKANASYEFIKSDMLTFAKNNKNLQIEVFLLPNVVNYIKKQDLIEFFKIMKNNKNIKANASFFIRCREPKDFRYGIGEQIEYNTFQMPDDYTVTSEASCINKFYSEYELVNMLKEQLKLKEYFVFHNEFQNLQENNTLVFNSDIILWGKIN
ncbi:methyltransferase domain-containing protein [Arcobacter sp. YIC-310]|uniref:methyltransferase domain-containing protein n=1 Tax=Arcobacter sp. YIC-310 TaxID=3376632 RepID=UPI003C262618